MFKKNPRQIIALLHTAVSAFSENYGTRNKAETIPTELLHTFIIGFSCAFITLGYNKEKMDEVVQFYIKLIVEENRKENIIQTIRR